MAGIERKRSLSIEQLRSALAYNPETGLLFWVTEGRAPNVAARIAGAPVGTFDGRYVRVKVKGVCYRAHQIAWALHHGAWAEDVIDHINGDGSDNRIVNLRAVTNSENMRNLHTDVRGWSGRRGVFFSRVTKTGPRWVAVLGGRRLGTFSTPEKAQAAYERARKIPVSG
jgi:hypothetical protein